MLIFDTFSITINIMRERGNCMKNILKKYIAPRAFYERVGKIAVPLALQMILNQAAGFVDTIMVSRIGGVGAVSVATQLDTIMMNVGFGINSGGGMYGAQFYGAKDYKSLRKIFGLQLTLGFINVCIFFMLANVCGRSILSFYSSDVTLVEVGLSYLSISCFAYLFTSVTQVFTFMYRAIQKTHVPMYVGIMVTGINICLNYCFIFGKFGFPEMGVAGAALATVIATACGTVTHIIYAIKTKQPFLGPIKEIFGFTPTFVKPIIKRMIPLICNETFFGFGNSLYVKAYGMISSSALETYKIGNTVANFFFIFAMGLNNATGLIIGELLGQNEMEKAKEYSNYFVLLAVIFAIVAGTGVVVFARPLVSLFGLTDGVMAQSAIMIVRLFAIRIAFRMFNVIIMSSLRAGGDSLFLMFLDGGVMWLIGLPIAYISVLFLNVTNVAVLFLLCQIEQMARLVIGLGRYKKGYWLKDLTKETK